MQRQCAWCLRLIDNFGERISSPQPKRYEVSHGMCLICGSLWLDQAILDTDKQEAKTKEKSVPTSEIEENRA